MKHPKLVNRKAVKLTSYNVGDKVKVTIAGTIKTDSEGDHSACHRIEDDNGYNHHIFLRSGNGSYGNGCTVDLVKPAEKFEPGKAYVDNDGDVVLRTESGRWLESNGATHSDSWATRPVKPLETATTLTETDVSAALRKAARQRSVMIGGETIRRMVEELKAAGVKVAG